MKQKLLIYLLNNQGSLGKKIDNALMLIISISQTLLIVFICYYLGLYLNYDRNDIILSIVLNIVSLQYLIRYLYTIEHYNVIKCTLFTLFINIIAFITSLQLYSTSVIVMVLIIIFLNKAEPKNSCTNCPKKDKDINVYYFHRGKSVGKKFVDNLLTTEIDKCERDLKILSDNYKFDYLNLAHLYYIENKTTYQIACILQYDESTINKKIEDIRKCLIYRTH